MSTSRRRFIEILPLAGAVSLLAACGKKEEAPVPVSAPTPAPTPSPAPAAAPAAPEASAPASGATGMVSPSDPQAVALGYVDEASKADKTKFASYVAGSACGNCALFAGKAGDATGACPLFGGKQVNAKGWCSGYSKKTA